MVPFSALFALVFGAAGCGSFSGVRVLAAPASGPVGCSLLFFFRGSVPAGLFCALLSARWGVAAAPVAGSRGGWSVAVPVAGAPLVPPVAVWLPAVRGGSPRGLASLLSLALGAS